MRSLTFTLSITVISSISLFIVCDTLPWQSKNAWLQWDFELWRDVTFSVYSVISDNNDIEFNWARVSEWIYTEASRLIQRIETNLLTIDSDLCKLNCILNGFQLNWVMYSFQIIPLVLEKFWRLLASWFVIDLVFTSARFKRKIIWTRWMTAFTVGIQQTSIWVVEYAGCFVIVLIQVYSTFSEPNAIVKWSFAFLSLTFWPKTHQLLLRLLYAYQQYLLYFHYFSDTL